VDDDSIFDADLTPKPLGESGAGNGNFTSGSAYVVRPITETYYSQPKLDGITVEYTEYSNTGGSAQAGADLINLGDDASNRQYRNVLSFNTSPIPDTAVITKAVLNIKRYRVVGGGNPVNIFKGFMADVKKGAFGTSALTANDFQAAASKTYGPFTTAISGGWYSIDLTNAKGDINKRLKVWALRRSACASNWMITTTTSPTLLSYTAATQGRRIVRS